ncbi:MAG: beta-ketoacyl-ACP synthase III [bacterium]
MQPSFPPEARGASRIVGTGRYVPEKVLTNHDLEEIVDTSDEWITSRTGIKRRHVAADDEATSDLAAKALTDALEDAGMETGDLDAVIVGTATPDRLFPSTACMVQQHLDLDRIPVFDVSAACSGFIYGSMLANSLIATGPFEHVAVVGAETLTRLVDWTDRTTCVLFGDGAGAAVYGPGDGESGVLAACAGADGSLADLLKLPAGGTRMPATPETVAAGQHFIYMEGSEVFKSAVRAMVHSAERGLELSGLTPDEVDLFIPHQANIRIIDATARRFDIPGERVFVNIHEYGNTSAASIPIALDEAREEGRVGEGTKVMMVAFGAGFTWGSLVVSF